MTSDTEASDNDLHIAVRYGDVKEVKSALKCRLSPNKIGLYQWSPLHEASSNGHIDIVQLLLSNGGNPNKADRLASNTALHYAAIEGHPTCLRLLIEAGGDYSLTNGNGETALDLATRACERVIEKKRVEKLMRMSMGKAKREARIDIHRIETTVTSDSPPPLTSTKESEDITIAPIEPVVVSPRTKAWCPQPTKHDPDAMGCLHMSFEYNSKKNYLKIRLWKLTGLMFCEPHSSMISTLYIKSALLPDARKQSKRKSEEIKLSSLLNKRIKPSQPYVTETGAEVLFEPITFKFSKPLVYQPISSEDIEHKAVYIQVALRQKYTQKTYKIADLSIPLQVAVRKIVKEAFTLRICSQTKLPDSMMVLADTSSQMITASDPNLRHGLLTPMSDHRPASDVNLREVLSVSSQSPSISVYIPSDEEAEIQAYPLARVDVQAPTSDQVAVPMPGVIEEPQGDDIQLHTVTVEQEDRDLGGHHTVRLIITNTSDSDSSSDDERQKNKRRNKLSSMFSRHSTDEVVVLESGQGRANSTNRGNVHNLVTNVNERVQHSLTKHKLRPKLPHLGRQSPRQLKVPPSIGNDVILPLEDLELEDFSEPVKIHKKVAAEQMV